ncbi:hypothetical protein COO60DRAFT_1493577 [Scenedesmus sp. NREL 46B-D3]|nr:hypothetical protein COO60DRAFT_1493577 [Scenedesmus sp. NREL 46B-D3]
MQSVQWLRRQQQCPAVCQCTDQTTNPLNRATELSTSTTLDCTAMQKHTAFCCFRASPTLQFAPAHLPQQLDTCTRRKLSKCRCFASDEESRACSTVIWRTNSHLCKDVAYKCNCAGSAFCILTGSVGNAWCEGLVLPGRTDAAACIDKRFTPNGHACQGPTFKGAQRQQPMRNLRNLQGNRLAHNKPQQEVLQCLMLLGGKSCRPGSIQCAAS